MTPRQAQLDLLLTISEGLSRGSYEMLRVSPTDAMHAPSCGLAIRDAVEELKWMRAEIERLRAEIERLRKAMTNMMIGWRHIRSEREEYRAEVERLRAALGWYADPRNHFPVERRNPGDPDPAVVFVEEPPIMSDGGERARKALEGKP